MAPAKSSPPALVVDRGRLRCMFKTARSQPDKGRDYFRRLVVSWYGWRVQLTAQTMQDIAPLLQHVPPSVRRELRAWLRQRYKEGAFWPPEKLVAQRKAREQRARRNA